MKRGDFPILSNITYLDSAATAQKPQVVVDAVSQFYLTENATVHRALYPKGVEATQLYEESRRIVADFIGASAKEIIFTKGCTEGLNFLATVLPEVLASGKTEILLSEMEHHANIVPWQVAADRFGLKLKFIPVKKDFTLDMVAAKQLITKKTGIVSVVHLSNTLGTVNNVKKLCKFARDVGAFTIIDGAQSIAHIPINIVDIGCDFFVFSGHKLYGPTGVGVLYGRYDVLEGLAPYQFGGNMINSVDFTGSTFADIPQCFEAGTTPIAQVIGMARAVRYVDKIGMSKIAAHSEVLSSYAREKLLALSGVRIIGPKQSQGVVSFVIEGLHPHDIAGLLGDKGVCVRGGHHCTMPLLKKFGLSGTTRLSFGLYNSKKDIDLCIVELKRVIELFK